MKTLLTQLVQEGVITQEETATVNGTTVSLDVPAQIINNSTFVPVRFIADSLGVTVNWNAENRTVEITTK